MNSQSPSLVTKKRKFNSAVIDNGQIIQGTRRIKGRDLDLIEQFRAEYACTNFIMATQFPGLDPLKVVRSLELFAREVRPHFAK